MRESQPATLDPTKASILLASSSPRRQELLSQLGLQFSVASQDIDESQRSQEAAMDYVQRMALEKAAAALQDVVAAGEQLIVAADTVVVCDAQVLGKPVDQADARRMLQLLSGREHQVLSAVCIARADRQRSSVAASKVSFREISEQEISAYWQTGEPLGKAGGYAIQGLAAIFVQHLVGSYSAVMGLPLFETSQLLQEFEVDVLPLALASGNNS